MPPLDGIEHLGPDGTEVPLTEFDADAHHVQRTGEALQKKLDPDHSKGAVHTQIGPGYGSEPMGGFVKAFVETRKPEDHVGRDLWIVPMGHYTGKDLPAHRRATTTRRLRGVNGLPSKSP